MIVYVLTSTRTFTAKAKNANNRYCVVEDSSDQFEGVAATPELLKEFVKDWHKYDGNWIDTQGTHGRSWHTPPFKDDESTVFFWIYEYTVLEEPLAFWKS